MVVHSHGYGGGLEVFLHGWSRRLQYQFDVLLWMILLECTCDLVKDGGRLFDLSPHGVLYVMASGNGLASLVSFGWWWWLTGWARVWLCGSVVVTGGFMIDLEFSFWCWAALVIWVCSGQTSP